MKGVKIKMQQVDYEFSSVPPEERKGFIQLTFIWMGYVIVIGNMLVGGALASGLSVQNAILAVLLGNIILSVIASFCAGIAHKTGLSFALVNRSIFGTYGSKVVTILVPLIFIGWFAINTSMFGAFIGQIFNISGFWELIIVLLCGLSMMITAWFGIKILGYFSSVSMPVVLILIIVALFKLGPKFENLSSPPSDFMPFTVALDIVIGAWIFGSLIVSMDVMRFSRNLGSAITGSSLGLILCGSLAILAGTVSAKAANNPDLSIILSSLGMPALALLLLVASIWTTNDNNLYSAALSLSNALRISKKRGVIILGVIASFASLIRPHMVGILINWLTILGKVIPPLGGIILAAYLLSWRGKQPLGVNNTSKWHVESFVAWVVGGIVAFAVPYGLSSINGLVVSGLVYYFWRHFSSHSADEQ